MAVPQEAPSPVIPMLVLFIVGTMMTLPNLMDYNPEYWNATVAKAQTHFIVGAFLIPVCLMLAVRAFGIPQVNPVGQRTPSSPFVEAITQNMTTCIILVGVAIILLMLNSLRNSLQGP